MEASSSPQPIDLNKVRLKRFNLSEKLSKTVTFTANQEQQTEKETFDWQFYLDYYLDLQGLSGKEAACKHWNRFGKAEGRFPHRAALEQYFDLKQRELPTDFDAEQYLKLNPDLQKRFGNSQYRKYYATNHYLMHGFREYRPYRAQVVQATSLILSDPQLYQTWLREEVTPDITLKSRFKSSVATRQPKFSVVVPIYDRTQLLYEALMSLRNQTCGDFEVLMVLDGSPTETVEVVEQFLDDERFRVYSYSEASGNACRGRNRGIIEAKGEFIALLDSDDLATPERLAVTLEAFETNDCDAVVGKAQYIILEDRPDISVDEFSESQVVPLVYSVLKRVNPIVTSTIAIRRDILLKYGGFRPEMRYREDHELWLRLVYQGCKILYLDKLFAKYRLHKTNNELNFKSQDKHWVDLMHQSYHLPFINWGV